MIDDWQRRIFKGYDGMVSEGGGGWVRVCISNRLNDAMVAMLVKT